jgi:hypothetical protein
MVVDTMAAMVVDITVAVGTAVVIATDAATTTEEP